MRDSNPQAQRAAVFKTADLPISLILQRARYFKRKSYILQAIIDIVIEKGQPFDKLRVGF